MSKLRPPRTTEQAIALLDRVAQLGDELAAIERDRAATLASTNATADSLTTPILTETAELKALLAPWWAANAAALTGGKRKSIELGGCMIGTKLGRAALDHNYPDEEAATAALQAHRWAKPYVRVRFAVDRTATLKAMAGPHAAKLAELGFCKKAGVDEFFVERVQQAGVIAA